MDIKNNGSQIVILKKLTIGSQDIDILEEIISSNSNHMIVVEYEAPNPSAAENELNIRRKVFYKRNGFCETGYFTFYDDTEFEIGCAGMEFDVELFDEFTEYLSKILSDHIPKPYKKA